MSRQKSATGRTFKRWVLRPITGAAVWPLYWFLRLLPLDPASWLGGAVAHTIGPWLSVSRRAADNLRRCFPEKDEAEITEILAEVWDNLGRVAGEYAHLDEFDVSGNDPRVELVGLEHLEAVRDDGAPGIFFSAHLANWEILSLGATAHGLPLTRIYREMNSPLAEKLLRRGVSPVAGDLVPKGRVGAMALNRAMKADGHIALMVDQKLNEGIELPFFGRPAMTAPALASFALKYRCPVVPTRVERLGGARFRATIYPPMELPDSGDREADTRVLMTQVNQIVEDWVRERPGQWFWLHRRWRD